MYELKKIGKVFTSKSVGTGPSSCGKSIYRTAVSQRLRNTALTAAGDKKDSVHADMFFQAHHGVLPSIRV